MSDDLLAELKMLKEDTIPKPVVDISDPKFGGELPNYQSYWKIFADQLTTVEGYTQTFHSTKSNEDYVLRVLAWKHGKFVINIPIDVKKDANGKFITMQAKDYKKAEVAKIKTHLTKHFQQCMANNTLPVDLTHFMKFNNYIDDVRGMLAPRSELTGVIKEFVPKPIESPQPDDAHEFSPIPEVPAPKSPQVEKKIITPLPKTEAPLVESESELYDFINKFSKEKNINPDLLLNDDGVHEYEKQREDKEVLTLEESMLVQTIIRNKRFLSIETLTKHLPAKIARRCNSS